MDLEDFEGDPRIAYGTVDMGGDEFFPHLYQIGDAAPGGAMEVMVVGLPGTSPLGLWLSTNLLDAPLPSQWGPWVLAFPVKGPLDLGAIPSPSGVMMVRGRVPAFPPGPYDLYLQALIGDSLSNPCTGEVR
jgi:hypothetical protein